MSSISCVYGDNPPGILRFSGLDWIIRDSRSAVGPGPNLFSEKSVAVGSDGLNFVIEHGRTGWECAEVYSRKFFSYGSFTVDFTIPEPLDLSAVFGFFLYNNRIPPYYNEIDFEASRWNDRNNHPFSFSVQPYGIDGNSMVFDAVDSGRYQCTIEWGPEDVIFTLTGNEGRPLKLWRYNGSSVPQTPRSRIHLNLWLFEGNDPNGDGGQTVTIHSFAYNKKD